VSEGNAPTFCIIHYQSALPADDPDHKTLFLHNHELYERAKERCEPFSEFAVSALVLRNLLSVFDRLPVLNRLL
jgi:hypothetical protein